MDREKYKENMKRFLKPLPDKPELIRGDLVQLFILPDDKFEDRIVNWHNTIISEMDTLLSLGSIPHMFTHNEDYPLGSGDFLRFTNISKQVEILDEALLCVEHLVILRNQYKEKFGR